MEDNDFFTKDEVLELLRNKPDDLNKEYKKLLNIITMATERGSYKVHIPYQLRESLANTLIDTGFTLYDDKNEDGYDVCVIAWDKPKDVKADAMRFCYIKSLPLFSARKMYEETKKTNSDTLRQVKAKVLDTMADPDRRSYNSVLLGKELSDRIFTSTEVRKVIEKAGFDLIYHNSMKGYNIKWDKLDTEANAMEWPCPSKEESQINKIAAKIRASAFKGYFNITIEGGLNEEDTKILKDLGYVLDVVKSTGATYITWFKPRDISRENDDDSDILSADKARSMALETNEEFLKRIGDLIAGKDVIKPIKICEEIPPLAFRIMLDRGFTIRRDTSSKKDSYTINFSKIIPRAMDEMLNDYLSKYR